MVKIVKNQLNYCIDGSGTATNLTALLNKNLLENEGKHEAATDFERKISQDERVVIDNFVRRCSSNEVVEADWQKDTDSNGQAKEGITTYKVRTKTSQTITIGIYENNSENCKDQMNVLRNAVEHAKEKISERRKDIAVVTIGGIVVTAAIGLSIWAGTIKLHEWTENNKKEDKTPIESTEEVTTELNDFATPIDATTEESKLEDKYSADTIREGMEKTNQQMWNQQQEDLKQRREDLGLSTDPGVPSTEMTVNKNYNDGINLTPDEVRAITEQSNQEHMEKQKQYVQDLRQSYLEEYKTR